MSRFHYGMNLREFDREFRALQGVIVLKRGTGERVYLHHLMQRRPRINGRRKDTPRDLTLFGMEIERFLNQQAANDDKY